MAVATIIVPAMLRLTLASAFDQVLDRIDRVPDPPLRRVQQLPNLQRQAGYVYPHSQGIPLVVYRGKTGDLSANHFFSPDNRFHNV